MTAVPETPDGSRGRHEEQVQDREPENEGEEKKEREEREERGEGDERTLRRLAAAGFPVHAFTGEQRAVFAALSAEELAIVLDIKARLDAVDPEVTAHAAVAGAALF